MACLCDLPQNGIGAKRCSGVIGIKSVYGGKSLGQAVDERHHLELARLAAEFRQHRIHAACENMVPVLLYMDTGRAAVCMACLLVELVKREVFRLEFQRQQADLQCMVQFDGTSLAAAGCERIHIHTQGACRLGMGHSVDGKVLRRCGETPFQSIANRLVRVPFLLGLLLAHMPDMQIDRRRYRVWWRTGPAPQSTWQVSRLDRSFGNGSAARASCGVCGTMRPAHSHFYFAFPS